MCDRPVPWVWAHVEVRGQLAGAGFLLPCGSWDRTQVTNLGSQCPYWLRSLAHPMGSVSVTFIVVAVIKFLQCETTFYCQSEFCVSLLIFNPQLHFSD